MLGVDNCGFMLCPSENNQNQQQGQFLFCFCFKYQRQLFYASNTREGTEEISDHGSKMPVFLVVVYLFYLIIITIYLFFFLGGGYGFFVLFLLLLLYDTTLNLPSIMKKPIKLATSVNNFHNSLHCLF